jgi:hypothetical protein
MNTIDTEGLSSNVIDIIDFICNDMMEKFPNIDFSIKKWVYNSDAILFEIHDDVFFSFEFQDYMENLYKNVIFPKKVLNIIFDYKDKKDIF